jgi:hypothetical protein
MQIDVESVMIEVIKSRELLITVAGIGDSIILEKTDPAPLRLGLASDSPYPVSWLADRLDLTVTEQQLIWILVAHEVCPLSRLKIREINTESVVDPTLDTLRRVVYGEKPSLQAWRELGADGKLRKSGLVDIVDEGPEHRQTVKLARRVLALVHGDTGLDADVHYAELDETDLELASLEVDAAARQRIADAFETKELVIVKGGAGSGRRSVIAATARAKGKRVLVVDGLAISKERAVATKQLRIVARECALFDAVPLIRQLEALQGGGEVADRLDLVETELPGPCFATTTRAIVRRWRKSPVHVELAPLGGAARARLWQRALPVSVESAEQLANLYPLAPALIDAAGKAVIRSAGGETLQAAHVAAGIRSVLDDRLAGLATRITVKQSWDDLVLPGEQITSVIELLARIRERGRVYEEWGFAEKLGKGLGISALFSGPPGTGKTMCAGLIARDLGTEIYQVDLSKLASKWIGETEKNLAALFDAAEAGHAILLFDEADAVFGKRTEVKSSNDRHANHETNYLLQRLESFTGICILTTNHENAIDEAFRRRLSVHVRFPMPEADERTKLWQALIPKAAPVGEDLRFEQLGQAFVMSGGYIRNAVLRAAFLAADAETCIDGRFLLRAAQLEYEAMGKVISRQ